MDIVLVGLLLEIDASRLPAAFLEKSAGDEKKSGVKENGANADVVEDDDDDVEADLGECVYAKLHDLMIRNPQHCDKEE